MSQISDYLLQAELALAAYADLFSGTPNTANLQKAGMSLAQANAFALKWSVVDQFNSITGVSATGAR